jgi:hypothetical protein
METRPEGMASLAGQVGRAKGLRSSAAETFFALRREPCAAHRFFENFRQYSAF